MLTLAEGTCCSKSNYPSVKIGWWYQKYSSILGDLRDGGPNDAGNWGQVTGIEQAFPDAPGTWHHLVVVRRGAEHAIYVDGVYRTGEVSGFIANLDHESASYIVGASSSFHFFGIIDELRIHSRALSDAEIGQLHQLTP